jgi:hypothetical protein
MAMPSVSGATLTRVLHGVPIIMAILLALLLYRFSWLLIICLMFPLGMLSGVAAMVYLWREDRRRTYSVNPTVIRFVNTHPRPFASYRTIAKRLNKRDGTGREPWTYNPYTHALEYAFSDDPYHFGETASARRAIAPLTFAWTRQTLKYVVADEPHAPYETVDRKYLKP